MANTTGGTGRNSGKSQAGKAKQAIDAARTAGLDVGGTAGRGFVQVPLRRGREYLRVSQDASGRSRSTVEQHADNTRESDRVGIVLGEPYEDTNRSASRYAKRAREDFDRLIGDLESGTFGAEVLVLWESSRGSRKVSEWVTLIELCESRGVLIHVTTHGRTYDPANGRDRRALLEDSVDSEHETWKISQRVKRGMAANAKAGKPHGRVPYGYRRVYDPETRKLVAQEPEPGEADIVREIFARLAKRHSLREIELDFAERGLRTRSGAVWSSQRIRDLALKRAYIGDRVSDPGRYKNGRTSGRDSDEARYVPGTWQGLVSRDVFFAVQEILADPKRKTSRPGRGVHFVSMIGRCLRCGGVIAASARSGEPQYVCHKRSCFRIPEGEVDWIAEVAIKEYLRRPDVREALARQAGNGEALKAARDEVKAIREEHKALARDLGEGRITPLLAAQSEPLILARLAAAEKRAEALEVPEELKGLPGPDDDIDQWWADAPMTARRTAARFLFTPERIGYLVILPAPSHGHRGPASERVEFRRDWNPATVVAPPRKRGKRASERHAQ